MYESSESETTRSASVYGSTLGRLSRAFRMLGRGSDSLGQQPTYGESTKARVAQAGVPMAAAAAIGPGRYAKATESLRATAKWLLATLAAVGAVLIAGLQLTSLGAFGAAEWPRLTATTVSASVALAAVGYMIAATSRIFTDEWVTLSDLDDESFELLAASSPNHRSSRAARRLRLLQDLREKIDNDRQGLYAHVAVSVPELYRRLREANETACASSGTELGWALSHVALVRAAVGEVTDCANYHRTRLRLQRLRPRLACASAVTVGAILIFAYAGNPADNSENYSTGAGATSYSSSPSMDTTDPARSVELDRMS